MEENPALDNDTASTHADPLSVLVHLDFEEQWKNYLLGRFPETRFRFVDEGADLGPCIGEADVLFTKSFPPEAMAKANRLRWVQAGSAGVDRLLRDGLGKKGVLLTNASGAHGIPMAELVLAMMLALATRLHDLIRAQSGRDWIKSQVRDQKTEVEGQVICVVGLGDIGGTLAKKAKGLGMRVIGIRRKEIPFEGIDETLPRNQLINVLPRVDHLALCLPLTSETKLIVGEKELRAMKPSSLIYNVGRGASLDQDALTKALKEGWIAGAGLDVTSPEPLPPESPLWDMPQVLLTQHTSGSSPFNSRRLIEIFSDNLERFQQGGKLRNLIDPLLEY